VIAEDAKIVLAAYCIDLIRHGVIWIATRVVGPAPVAVIAEWLPSLRNDLVSGV
jgi:hypothetical protein